MLLDEQREERDRLGRLSSRGELFFEERDAILCLSSAWWVGERARNTDVRDVWMCGCLLCCVCCFSLCVVAACSVVVLLLMVAIIVLFLSVCSSVQCSCFAVDVAIIVLFI